MMSLNYWMSLRLYVQLAIASGILLAITIAVATWFNISTQKKGIIEDTTNEAISLARNVAITSRNLVITDKLDELETQLIQSASFPGVTMIRVFNIKGESLSHVRKDGSGEIMVIYDNTYVELPILNDDLSIVDMDWDTNSISVWHPIKTSTLLGWVRLRVSFVEAARLQEKIILDNIKGAIIAIVLDILLLLAILFYPIRSFWKVVNFAATMTDKPGAQINFPGGSYEVNNLIKALNLSSLILNKQQNEISAKQKELEHLAHHDQLTQLPNRPIFIDRLENAIKNAKRNKSELVVVFLDLNKFKPVNDIYGHHVGDLLLQQFAQRLKSCVRESDSLARFGGDEFVVLLTNVASDASLSEIILNLRKSISDDFIINEKHINISMSVGYATYPSDGTDPDVLLSVADHNMYADKKSQKEKVRA